MSVLKAFDGCTTPADFYKVQIALENLATPLDLRRLVRGLDQVPEPARQWLRNMSNMMNAAGAPTQGFIRTNLGDHLTLFKSGRRDGERKRLLVSFSGVYPYRPLAIPTPVFLQHVPADRFDVILLRDPKQLFYLKGIPGYADDIAGVAGRLREFAVNGRYRSIRSIGMSAGGFAALVAGTLAGADCAVGFCCLHPTSGRHRPRVLAAGLDGFELDRALQRAPAGSAPKIMLLFGAGNQGDRDGANALGRMFPQAKLVELAGVSSHHLPYELLKRGLLRRVVDQAFLDGFDARYLSDDSMPNSREAGR